ncbi:MAG: hypothetical protein MCS20_01760, partial [Candidatus Phytoplasma mali]|nr:hypothetical protein [Candidatus Phytoplasma australiense]MCG7202118.1 hypothetical protein [Candidatus Phytoplasma mali]
WFLNLKDIYLIQPLTKYHKGCKLCILFIPPAVSGFIYIYIYIYIYKTRLLECKDGRFKRYP